MKPVIFHPEASTELTEASRYYESRSRGLGQQLIEEIRASLIKIAESPEAYQRIGKRVRRKPLWQFPYNVIFAIYPDRIRIVAFAHQKRRPFYWRKRIADKLNGQK